MREVDPRTRYSRRFLLKAAAISVPAAAVAGGTLSDAWAEGRRAEAGQHEDAGEGGAGHLPPRFPGGHLLHHRREAVEREGGGRSRRQGDAGGRHRETRCRRQAAHGVPYVEVGWEADRVTLLKGIESTDFFKKVRGDLVVSLYNQKEIWPSSAMRAPPPTRAATSIAASTTSTGCRRPDAKARPRTGAATKEKTDRETPNSREERPWLSSTGTMTALW